jgi:ribosomal protein L9
MTKPQITEFNCETQTEIIRDATNAEIKQMDLDRAHYEAAKAEAEAQANARKALLNKLGITADEAKLLLG